MKNKSLSISIFMLFVLIFLGCYCPVFATVTEVNIEVDPFISHSVEEKYFPGTNILTNCITDSLGIEIPDIALSSGDIFHVNVSFSEQKLLKIVNAAPVVNVYPTLSTIESGGFGISPSDCSIQVQITNHQNVTNITKTKLSTFEKIWGQDEYRISGIFSWYRNSGEITDGSLMGGFQIEFKVPTMYEGNPVPLANYTCNTLLITSVMYDQYFNDIKLLEVIPEPATLSLLGIGGLLIRRKK